MILIKIFNLLLRFELTDPYIRAFFQIRNLMELIETIAKAKQLKKILNLN